MKVHVFKGKNGDYGFTADSAGANLPQSNAPWLLVKSMDMVRGETPRVAVDTDAAISDIETTGHHIITAKIRFTEDGQ